MPSENKKDLLEAKKDIQDNYTDVAGMITEAKNPGYCTTLNGLMQTGFAVTLYADLEILTKEDKDNFRNLVRSCEDSPGVYDRYPAVDNKPKIENMNAHDDTRGVIAGSLSTWNSFQKDVLEYGLNHLFFYDNENESSFFNDSLNPKKWNWSGVRLRMWKDILWYFLVNQRLMFLSPVLMLALTLSLYDKEVDYHQILNYLIVSSMSRVSTSWEKFSRFYLKRSKLTESTAKYFGNTHPLVVLAKEVEYNASYR